MTPEPKRELGAGIIVYRVSPEGYRYLLLYKSKNYWNFPRGTVETEERAFQAALRETKEETGLTDKDLRVEENFRVHERFGFRRAGEPILKMVILYLAETKKREVWLSTEHQGYAWLSYAEARKFLGRFKGNVAPLVRAHGFLMRKWKKDGQDKPKL